MPAYAPIQIAVLGPLRVATDGHTTVLGKNQRSTLLAVLLSRQGRLVTFDSLAEELGTSRQNVMKAKAKLALDLGEAGLDSDQLLVTGVDGYRLAMDDVTLDAVDFELMTSEAERVVDADPSKALFLVTAALDLWGSPFQGVPPTFCLDVETSRLEAVYRRTRLARCAALLGTGQPQVAEGEARALLENSPDDESASYHLATALALLGRQFDALDELKRLNEVRAGRGTVPSPALQSLEDSIVRGEVGYDRTRPAVQPVSAAHPPEPIRLRINTRTRFVGGRALLDELTRTSRWVRQGEPAICLVEGVAGLGKTRVSEEWASSPEVAPFRQCWIEYRQLDDGAFRRHLEVLTEALGLAPVGDIGDRDMAEDVIDHRLVASLLDVARRHPLLLVVEDVHWADERSRRFLDRLVTTLNRLAGAPRPALMVLLTSRPPGPGDPAAGFLERLRRGRRVSWHAVEALNDLETHELLTELGVPQPSGAMVRTTAEVACGNPLAIRALVLRLERMQALARRHGQTVIELPDEAVPQAADVDSIVAWQLDALSKGCREVLSVAAVLGRQASRSLVAHLVGDPDVAEVGIAEAVRVGVLVDVADNLRFTHPLTAQLALATRRPHEIHHLHVQAADFLRTGNDRDPSIVTSLADHLVRAGPAADTDLLARYGRAAGEAALDVAAWSDAVRYLGAALRAAEQDLWPTSRLAPLRLKLAEAAFRDHQIALGAAMYDEVATYGHDTGDVELWGQGIVGSIRCLVHDPTLFDVMSRAAALAEFVATAEKAPLVSASLRATAHQLLATLAWGGEMYDVARDQAEKAQVLARSADEPLIASQAALLHGLAHYGTLNLVEALASFRLASEVVTPGPSPIFRRWGATRSALTHWTLGDLQPALELASEAADAAEQSHNWAEACLARTIVAGVEQALAIPTAVEHAVEAQWMLDRSQYYWAGTILLPVRFVLAGVDHDIFLQRTLIEQAGTNAPLYLRVLLAIAEGDTVTQRQLQAPLSAELNGPPSLRSIPSAVAAAELALITAQPDLAAASLRLLSHVGARQVVMVPGLNQRLDDVVARLVGSG